MKGTLYITGDKDADELLNTDPLALLLGMLLDQKPLAHAKGADMGLHMANDSAADAVLDEHPFAVLLGMMLYQHMR